MINMKIRIAIFFNEHVIDSMIQEGADLVGISVTATSQVMPAFTLARLLKEKSE